MKRSSWIVRYQAIPDRLVQTLLEQPVDVPHGMLPQPWVAVTAEAPTLLQKISHLLHRQFRERDLPQFGENVVLEEITVGRIGSRPALVLVADLLSAEDVLFQRHIPTSLHWRCRFRKATHGKPACFRIRLWR